MRSIQRRSKLGPMLLVSGLLFVGVVGTVIVLAATGVIDLPFLRRPVPYQPPEGTVPVVLSVKPIPAYTRIARDHLFQINGRPKLFHLRPEEVAQRGILTDVNKILGRVAGRDIREGYAFREKDFLPDGAREGVAGGTPPGKRSLALDATKIAGVNNFKAGDHFDLVASYLNELPPDDAKQKSASFAIEHLPGQKKYVVSRVVVQDGVVLQPLTTRPVPKPNSSVPSSGKMAMIAIQEIVLAVEPAEVAGITEAMSGASEVRLVHRSGQPDEKYQTSPTPSTELKKIETVRIDVIRGKKRETLIFPKPAPRPAVPRPQPELPQPPQRFAKDGRGAAAP